MSVVWWGEGVYVPAVGSRVCAWFQLEQRKNAVLIEGVRTLPSAAQLAFQYEPGRRE